MVLLVGLLAMSFPASTSLLTAWADPSAVPTSDLTPVPTADPTPVDGPDPGAPIVVQPGDRFPVDDIHLPISDQGGVAKVVSTPAETEVRLDATVLFGKDESTIQAKAGSRLTEVAAQLKRLGPGALTVTGYTDDLGSAAHGLTLSRQRAAAVARRLEPHLDAADTVAVVGKGEADPEVPNDSEAHRRLNRRVIITFRPR